MAGTIAKAAAVFKTFPNVHRGIRYTAPLARYASNLSGGNAPGADTTNGKLLPTIRPLRNPDGIVAGILGSQRISTRQLAAILFSSQASSELRKGAALVLTRRLRMGDANNVIPSLEAPLPPEEADALQESAQSYIDTQEVSRDTLLAKLLAARETAARKIPTVKKISSDLRILRDAAIQNPEGMTSITEGLLNDPSSWQKKNISLWQTLNVARLLSFKRQYVTNLIDNLLYDKRINLSTFAINGSNDPISTTNFFLTDIKKSLLTKDKITQVCSAIQTLKKEAIQKAARGAEEPETDITPEETEVYCNTFLELVESWNPNFVDFSRHVDHHGKYLKVHDSPSEGGATSSAAVTSASAAGRHTMRGQQSFGDKPPSGDVKQPVSKPCIGDYTTIETPTTSIGGR